MATYSVEVSATAERQLRRLPRSEQVRVVRAIRSLRDEPRPPGCRKLSGYDDVFRVRVGRYRVIYTVEDRVLRIVVLKVGHRSAIYR